MHQHHGGLMTVFSLAADVADRLVDQDRDLLALLLLGLPVDFNARIGGHGLAHDGGLAIDTNPALFNPRISLAARAQAKLGHAFIQADGGRRVSRGHRRGAHAHGAGRRRFWGCVLRHGIMYFKDRLPAKSQSTA